MIRRTMPARLILARLYTNGILDGVALWRTSDWSPAKTTGILNTGSGDSLDARTCTTKIVFPVDGSALRP